MNKSMPRMKQPMEKQISEMVLIPDLTPLSTLRVATGVIVQMSATYGDI
jgi:hypothetical protein